MLTMTVLSSAALLPPSELRGPQTHLVSYRLLTEYTAMCNVQACACSLFCLLIQDAERHMLCVPPCAWASACSDKKCRMMHGVG